MDKSKFVSYYWIFHTVFITCFCLWYFVTDAYFGYEIGDQLIILIYIIFAILFWGY